MKIYPVFLMLFLIGCQPLQLLEMKPSETMRIHISGAVLRDEWLEVTNFSTFEDILPLIHFDDNADIDNIHPTQILRHLDRIIIPYKKDVPCISLNHANVEDLMSLVGIGQVSAQRIVDYRVNVGLFRKIEDIMNIKGIKEATFSKIKDHICL